MTEEKKQPTGLEAYQVWQKYFEEQQTLILQYWTAVLNSMWGTGK